MLVLLGVAVVAALLLVLVTGYYSSDRPVSFSKSVLQGTSSDRASSLQFGPDGRLYVAQYDGSIKVYTIERAAPNSYAVTETETINEIQSIPNYNDDGSPSS